MVLLPTRTLRLGGLLGWPLYAQQVGMQWCGALMANRRNRWWSRFHWVSWNLKLSLSKDHREARVLGSKLQKRLWVWSLAMKLLGRGSLDCRNIMLRAELWRWEIGSPEKEHKLSKAIQEHVWQRKVKRLIWTHLGGITMPYLILHLYIYIF